MSIINFSSIVEDNGKTIKENNMKKTHNIPLNTLVEVDYDKYFGNGVRIKGKARMFVVECGRDCDGTPLYWLATAPKKEWFKFASNITCETYYHFTGGYSEEYLTIVDKYE